MRLGELLVAAGVIEETGLNAALAEQRKWGGKLGRVIVDMKLVSEDLMVKALARQLGISRIDLDRKKLPEDVTQLLGVDICERYGVFPVGQNEATRTLQVAAGDPTNYEALDEVAFRSGMKVEPVVASATAVDRAIRRYYYGEGTTASDTLDPSKYGLDGGENFEFDDSLPNGVPPGLISTLDRLERTIAGEVKALRGLIELLVEKGLIDREDYLAKVRNK